MYLHNYAKNSRQNLLHLHLMIHWCSYIMPTILFYTLDGNCFKYTAEKNMTNTLTLVPVGMDVGFDDRLEVLLY